MECVEVVENGKTYNSELDVWIDKAGCMFVKNEFDPGDHQWIDVAGHRWSAVESTHWIDWDDLGLPVFIERAFKRYLRFKLRINAPQYLKASRYALQDFSRLLMSNEKTLSDLSMAFFARIWSEMIPHYASWVREAYVWFASHGEDGAKASIAYKLRCMKVRHDVRPLKDVLNWHPTKGALTQEEEMLLRKKVEAYRNESVTEQGVRLFCWLLISTLKRSKQIRDMRSNCLKVVENNGTMEHFVLIKPVKSQTGDPERWWPIQESLYLEMQRYTADPSVRELQQRYDRFWVLDCPSLHRCGTVSAADAKARLQAYIKSTLRIVSPTL